MVKQVDFVSPCNINHFDGIENGGCWLGSFKIPWRVSDHETGLSSWTCSIFFLHSIYSKFYLNVLSTVLRGKSKTQISYLSCHVCCLFYVSLIRLRRGGGGSNPISQQIGFFFQIPAQIPQSQPMLLKFKSHSHFSIVFVSWILVPVRKIPFLSLWKRQISALILPLQDPLKSIFQFALINTPCIWKQEICESMYFYVT